MPNHVFFSSIHPNPGKKSVLYNNSAIDMKIISEPSLVMWNIPAKNVNFIFIDIMVIVKLVYMRSIRMQEIRKIW